MIIKQLQFNLKILKRLLSKINVLIVIISFSIISCGKKDDKFIHSFYYWKTEFSMNSKDYEIMKQLNVKHFYIKYLDVDWSTTYNAPVPIGEMSNVYKSEVQLDNITPCVFITNTVMSKCNNAELDDLARKIKRKIDGLNADFESTYTYGIYDRMTKGQRKDSIYKLADSVRNESEKRWRANQSEIQIDCDWTEATREKYFYFLKQIKKQFPEKKISCTLRLWQYKYSEKAGIPPVDKCLLMCYSVTNTKDIKQTNSIATYNDVKSYFGNTSYPIHLDIALPIYSWAVLFRNGQFKNLIGNMESLNYQTDTLVYRKIADNRYLFKRDTVIGDIYLRYGDEIRVEQLSDNELNKIVDLIQSKIKINKDTKISFFSWDTTYIKHYGIENIKKYYNQFN